MPTPRVTMSKIRHTLQLLHGVALSPRQIGAALGISKSTVIEIASYARVASVDWALAQTLSDEELQSRLYKPPVPRASRHLEPDFAHIHRPRTAPPRRHPATAVGGVPTATRRSGLQIQRLLRKVPSLGPAIEAFDAPDPRSRRQALCGLRRPDRAHRGRQH